MANSKRIPPSIPEFTPVPRKIALTHGWIPEKQRGFIEALRDTGSVRLAAEAVGMSHTHVYRLRRQPGGESFARAWDEAVRIGAKQIRDILIDQAIHGIPETVVMGGERIERRRFNHRTMMWTLQHHMPDEYPGGHSLPKKRRGPRGRAVEGSDRGSARDDRAARARDQAAAVAHDGGGDAGRSRQARGVRPALPGAWS
jgi:hypothetical protein